MDGDNSNETDPKMTVEFSSERLPPEGETADTVQESVKTTETVEEEVIPDGPGVGLDEALLKQRQQEKEAFQKLITENVKLEKSVATLSSDITDLRANHEVLIFNLQEEKDQNAEQSQRITDMEKEIRSLKKRETKLTKMIEEIMTSKKSKKKKKGGQMDEEKKEEKDTDEDEEKAEPGGMTATEYQNKISDLQVRLKRIAKEDHEKNCRITALDAELKELRHLVEEMEKRIEPAEMEKIRKSCKEMDKTDYPKPRLDDRANVVKADEKQSKVCAIL